MKIKLLIFLLLISFIQPIKSQTNNDKMQWFDKARWGMFIHWGLYSVPAGVYNGLNTEGETVNYTDITDPTGVGAEWMMKRARIPKEVYAEYADRLSSENWNPDAICLMAQKMGMKYIIVTSKHHDGFMMYPSSYDDYNITKSKADPEALLKLKQKCDEYGLKFGVYFSQNYDWFQPGGFGQENVSGTDIYSYEEHKNYVDRKVLPVIDELVDKFDPAVIWWDIPTGCPYKDLSDRINQKYKDRAENIILSNDRLSEWHSGDFGTGEGNICFKKREYNENCFTLNWTWGYSKNKDNKEYFFTPENFFQRNILESIARSQNVLLNISPMADGGLSNLTQETIGCLTKYIQNNQIEISGTQRVNKYSFPNWGKMIKKGNELILFIYPTKENRKNKYIYVDGINTENLISNPALNIEIISKDRLKINNLDLGNSLFPAVIKLKFDGGITCYDYNIIDNNTNVLNINAFDMIDGAGYLDGFDDTIYMQYLIYGTFNTRILYNGPSELKKISLNNTGSGSNDIIIILKINDKEYQLDAGNQYSIDQISFSNGKIYDLSIEKVYHNSNFNISNLSFKTSELDHNKINKQEQPELKITNTNTGINISGQQSGQPIVISTISGTIMKNIKASKTIENISLQPGIYIITSLGKTYKTIVY